MTDKSKPQVRRRRGRIILRYPDVERRLGCSRSTVKRKVIRRELRKPIPIGPNSVGWFDDWIDEHQDWLLEQAGVAEEEAV